MANPHDAPHDPTPSEAGLADPADVAEQHAEVGPHGALDESRLSDDPEVPEADNLEQASMLDGAVLDGAPPAER